MHFNIDWSRNLLLYSKPSSPSGNKIDIYLYFYLNYFCILFFNPEYLEYILAYKWKKSCKRKLLRVLWTNLASITKASHIWAPENWSFLTLVLEKILESFLDSYEIKPVNPKEINPEYSLEGLMLKLKLQYSGHLTQRVYSLEKTPTLRKIEDRRKRGQRGWDDWMASLT